MIEPDNHPSAVREYASHKTGGHAGANRDYASRQPDGLSNANRDHVSNVTDGQSCANPNYENSPSPSGSRDMSPLSELSSSMSIEGVTSSVDNSYELAPPESIAASGSFTLSEAIDLVDWVNHRKVRGYRKGAGQTVWYRSSGFAPLQAPPALLCTTADRTDLFLFHDMRNSKVQVWILGEDRVWHTVEDGQVHPTDASRHLRILPCGDPSWVTRATYNGYTYHRRKAAGNVRK